MADEPSLPPIPPSKAADAIFGPNRKRVRLNLLDSSSASGHGLGTTAQQLLSNSSDPAVFSSDDDPALDNYAPEATAGRSRKKKRYVGAWFAQHPASADSTFDEVIADGAEPRGRTTTTTLPLLPSSPVRQGRPSKKQRRTFERQFDSGVWMGRGGGGDDANENNTNDVEFEQMIVESPSSPPPGSQASTSSQLSLAPPPAPPLQTDFPPPPPRQRRVFQRVPSLAVDTAEKKAREMIQECIEAGDEEVSLIGLGLTALTNATVEPLSGLVPIPIVTEGVAFEQKEPSLKVFLSSNHLTRLPGALFNLEHLTVLSLRGNGLTELPPAIGKLRHLRSLNVSLNALRFLPAELLPLIHTSGQGGHLAELLVHPNPYFAPEGSQSEGNDGSSGGSPLSKSRRRVGDRPARVARSPVRYMDSAGNTLSSFTMEPAVLGVCNLVPTEDLTAAVVPPLSSNSTATPARVPTLVELALEACYRTPQLGLLGDLLPDNAPPHLGRQLDRALDLRDEGGRTCSVCRRPQPLVAPMTEWLEWYAFARSDIHAAVPPRTDVLTKGDIDVLPFVWRGCSWGCVPQVEEVDAGADKAGNGRE